ncbi:MAG: hypothetical protein ACPGQ5_09430, partial [Alphaproteobacteria bacterium]
ISELRWLSSGIARLIGVIVRCLRHESRGATCPQNLGTARRLIKNVHGRAPPQFRFWTQPGHND